MQGNGLTGLANVGNTCYLNSCIQALSHTLELQDALDAANKQLKKEGIVIASKDEFIKTLIQTPAAA